MLVASQSFLATFVHILAFLHPHLEGHFTPEQFDRMSHILRRVVSVPVDSTTQSFLVTATASLVDQSNRDLVNGGQVPVPLTPLQEAVYSAIDLFARDFVQPMKGSRLSDQKRLLICPLFELLLSLFSFATRPPSFDCSQEEVIAPPVVRADARVALLIRSSDESCCRRRG